MTDVANNLIRFNIRSITVVTEVMVSKYGEKFDVYYLSFVIDNFKNLIDLGIIKIFSNKLPLMHVSKILKYNRPKTVLNHF